MIRDLKQAHVSGETLQALLEGQLAAGEARLAEEHLAVCPRCAAEREAWQALFGGLSRLPALDAPADFHLRVMEGVRLRATPSLAARIAARIGGALRPAHPGLERLQDYLDGRLAVAQAARVERHLDGCAACAAEAARWRATFAELDALQRLAPAEAFADRVMARVRLPAPAVAAATAPRRARALAWLGRAVPQTRQAWAALSGVALTPAVTLGLVLWTLVTHPTLTAGALASFAWWKATELAGAAWELASASLIESAGVFRLYAFLESMALSPTALAGGFLLLSAGTVAASWVLYRNLFSHHPMDGRIAHAPLS